MSEPKLRVKASGFSGSGYFQPFTSERVIGVTTATGVLDKPALRQWVADQTAAYAAVNAAKLLDRDEEQAFSMLRWYHSRFKSSDWDDPLKDVRDAHVGVLEDAANLGTRMHEHLEATLQGWLEPDLFRDEEVQMAEQLLIWLAENDVEVYASEATVFGSTSQGFGFGGTCDLFAKVNGVPMCLDLKTGRGMHDTHYAQLAALSAADTMAVEVAEGTPGAIPYTSTKDGVKSTTYWVPEALPPVAAHGIIHLRPDDYDSRGRFKPAFCEMHIIDQRQIDVAWELFEASVAARHAQRKLKDVTKMMEQEVF